MSQNSQIWSSQASTIPYEVNDSQDQQFVEELNIVDQLYFERSELEPDLSDSSVEDDNYTINYDSDSSSESVHVPLEQRLVDQSEYLKHAAFRNDTCGCSELYGEPCSMVLDFDTMVGYREDCMEMSREELDVVVKAQLQAHRSSGGLTRNKKKDRQRSRQTYFFRGQRVCRQTFCFVHGMERKKLQALAASLDEIGLQPRVHGLCKKQPSHSLTYVDRERIKDFIVKYAKDNALPLPGRLPNVPQSVALILPSDKSITEIHSIYEASATEAGYRNISLRSFQRVWKELCPHISLSKPKTDLCQKCQKFVYKLSNGGDMSEEEKQQLLAAYNKHLAEAKEQRSYYNQGTPVSKLFSQNNATENGRGGIHRKLYKHGYKVLYQKFNINWHLKNKN